MYPSLICWFNKPQSLPNLNHIVSHLQQLRYLLTGAGEMVKGVNALDYFVTILRRQQHEIIGTPPYFQLKLIKYIRLMKW
jgi:hypothetical protein